MTAGWFLAALRHDRAVVLGGLAFVVLLAWTYLLLGAGVGMEMMDMGGGRMMAMLLPSAAPVTLLIAGLARKRTASDGAVQASTALFVFGYLVVWLAFAAA